MADSSGPPQDGDASPLLQEIIDTLSKRRGLDFRAYRAATLARRVKLQIHASGASGAADYLTRLQSDPAEADRLLGRITIKATGFFRDGAAFEQLAPFLARRPAQRPLAIWSAGCAQGEEAYTLAMLARELGNPAASVLASDLDQAAIRTGESGCYPAYVVRNLSPERLAANFELVRHGKQLAYRIRPSLRDSVRFVQHNLLSGSAPEGGPFDVILCRNVLIYWSRSMQEQIQQLLLAALAPGGILCLGPAEWLAGPVSRELHILNAHHRIFQSRGNAVSEVTDAS